MKPSSDRKAEEIKKSKVRFACWLAIWLTVMWIPAGYGQIRKEPEVSALVRALLQDVDWRSGESAFRKAGLAAMMAQELGDVVGEAVAKGIWARSLVAMDCGVMDCIPQAVKIFREAASIWQKTSYRIEYVEALLEIPVLRVQRPRGGGVFSDADRLFADALHAAKVETEHPLVMAATLAKFGEFFANRDAREKAEELLKAALTLRERYAPDSVAVAQSLSDLALLWKDRGNTVGAIDAYRRALSLYNKHQPESLAVVRVLRNLGVIAEQEGDLKGARSRLDAALAICDKIQPNSLECSSARNSLGVIASREGNLAQARSHLQKALAIVQGQESAGSSMGIILDNLAWVMTEQGDFEAAKSYVSDALKILQRHKDPDRLAGTWETLGNIASREGDLATAFRSHTEALRLRRQSGKEPHWIVSSLRTLAMIERSRGNLPAAGQLYSEAVNVYERLPSHPLSAALLADLGSVAMNQNESAKARDLLTRALSLQQSYAPESLHTASILRSLAVLELKEDNLSRAEELARQAWRIANEQRAGIVGDETRQAFAASVADYNEFFGFVQALGYNEEAFATVEDGKAYSLRQLFVERQLVGATEDEQSVAAYRAAQRERDRAEEQLTRTTIEADAAANSLQQVSFAADDKEKLNEARTEAEKAKRSVELARERLVRARVETDARWTALQPKLVRFAPPTMSFDTLGRAIPAGAIYVSFVVTDHGAVLFIRESSDVHPLPIKIVNIKLTRREIEIKVREFVGQLRNPQSPLPPIIESSRALFVSLFPSPELRRDILSSQSHLIISPDGPLWDLPFEALITNEAESPDYLGLVKKLSYTQALSLLGSRHEQKSPESKIPAALVVGNPVFDRRESSLANEDRFRGCAVEPLPATQREAEQVARFYNVAPLTGERATESNVRAQISNADIIHFATHGCLHPLRAMASSLLLTPSENVNGSSDDGMLQAWEIASQLKLKAKLVVLSACETGRGDIVKSEGIVGLTRALQAAGAGTVVASHWKVKDSSTAKLMVAFHDAVRKGLDFAAALQQAMLQVRNDPTTEHPFYWAAFRVIGESTVLPSPAVVKSVE